MTPYNPGDVVLIPFPFTDFSTFKQRPAVILSSGEFNRSGADVIIAAVTSHLREKHAYDYVLNGEEQEAADQRLIRKRLGQLPRASTTQIVTHLHSILSES
jgi:mRNA-degrading endonuclease toxin of MazEF toxin-antitoxin module